MNIVELLAEYNIPTAPEGHEHTRSGWAQVDCPFCSPGSGRFRLGINIQHVYGSCWSCGYHSVPSVLKMLLGVRWDQAKKLLDGIQHERVEKIVHHGHYKPPAGVGPLLSAHKNYLRDRGFNPHELEHLWDIQGIGIAARLSWRIFIPIIHHGQTVSWTTRTISREKNVERKYLSAGLEEESLPHKHLLYGEDYCRHAIIVVEGPIDVWGGGPGFAATFGLSFTSEQVARIASYPVRAICMDAEPEAQKTAKELADRLSCLPGETYNVTLDSKDPGEATQREIQRLRKEILE